LSDPNISPELLGRAAKLVTPSAAEIRKLERVVKEIEDRMGASLEKEKVYPKPQVTLGGSYARGTWLKGSHDVDFFLMYPVDFPREKLETVAISTASAALEGYPINKRYAEHPYVESFVEGVRINLVPCYAVASGEWQSAADRSPYHTKYIQAKLNERLQLEVRLFKKFAKSSEVYGAEVKIRGFSGYVCEILTIKYGSFLQALQALSNLNQGQVISIENYDQELAASFKSPVVILDPVDTTRNLGSAISARNIGKLALYSRRFLSRPSIKYFLPKKIATMSMALKKSKRLLFPRILVVSFRIEPRSPDILWGELKKSSSSLADKLSGYGYRVLRHSAATDEKKNAALLFLISSLEIESLSVRQGPDYFRAEEVEKYFVKNRGRALMTWIGGEGKLESVFDRNEIMTKASSTLKWILSKDNIDQTGVSARIKRELLKQHQILHAPMAINSKKYGWLTKEILEMVSSD
jgi:tRNA nucleotidyltransferase (CCA-adding enzyme)